MANRVLSQQNLTNQSTSRLKNLDQTPSHQQKTRRTNAEPAHWRPPDPGWVKINVNGAFTPRTNDGSVAGVCRDENGVLLDDFARSVKVQSPLHAETLAVCEGLELAVKWRKKEGSRGGSCSV
ncbi:hypothetical protein ACJRO7_012300 [Eucalyptus globulus]|uniref:RNase H type-1 domain-containing protein n=1 Tax=Eucalyptus globulus TaxID=34317 RepID=A0ABD3LNJ2_EUCGL